MQEVPQRGEGPTQAGRWGRPSPSPVCGLPVGTRLLLTTSVGLDVLEAEPIRIMQEVAAS